mmetsp:Transcript_37260/g.73151  ORF Transcript_37260/g.73151 Transcript_37260/m.73151 type:complete len:448 (+) Transcript_37260:291-1634(+)
MSASLAFFVALLLLLVPTAVLGVGRFSYKEDDWLGPSDWDRVKDSKNNFWKKFPKMKVGENECGDRKNKQSPVNLVKNDGCKGDHHILIDDGKKHCDLDEIDFKIRPFGLEGFFESGCEKPAIDIADSFHERDPARFELKVPSEHTIEGERFDGEFQIYHLKNTNKKNKGNREDLISATSVLLDASKNDHNDWLEELLDGWEDAAKKEREGRCGGAADAYTVASPVGTPTSKPTRVPTSKPTAAPTGTYKYLGCYNDKKKDRMFSNEAQHREASVEECSVLCEGYKFFLRQYKGQCFCGNSTEYARHGSSSLCDCHGVNVGSYKGCVYDNEPSESALSLRRFLRGLKKKKKRWSIYSPFKKEYYYGYRGSLTSPPCSNSVNWYVMNDQQKISRKQLERIQDLITGYLDEDCQYGTYAKTRGGEVSVARPIQDSRRRSIFKCTKADYR